MKTFIPIILLLASMLSFGVALGQETTSPRTQYESFDLSTPEAAVETFVDVFQHGDYAGLFLILSPEAQHQFQLAFNIFRYEWLIDSAVSASFTDALEDIVGFDHTEAEHSAANLAYLFDSIMLYAEENDAFLIDLRGEVEILRTEDSTIPAADRAGASGGDDGALPAVDVVASTEREGELRFRMVQVPSGRWRVYQVIVPGGDEERLPWAVRSTAG